MSSDGDGGSGDDACGDAHGYRDVAFLNDFHGYDFDHDFGVAYWHEYRGGMALDWNAGVVSGSC
jgi:hypothetical protein